MNRIDEKYIKPLIISMVLIIAMGPIFSTSLLYKKINNDFTSQKVNDVLYALGIKEQQDIIDKSNEVMNYLKIISIICSNDNLDAKKFSPIVDFIKESNKIVFDKIIILDKNYKILYGNNYEMENLKEKDSIKISMNGLKKISHIIHEKNKCYLEVGLPINKEDNVIGTVYAKVNLQFLNEIILNSRFLDESTDSYVVAKDGMLITEPRFAQNSIEKLSIDIKKVKSKIDYCKNSSYKDYRDIEVYGKYFEIPIDECILIVEEDKSILEDNDNNMFKVSEIMAILQVIVVSISKVAFDKLVKPALKEENKD